MSILGKEFIRRFEEYCPLWLAEEGDPCGLHIGTLDREIQRVMMTLDVRPEVVQEAIDKKVDLLIAKHPPIFRPISRLTEDDLQTKMYIDLLRNNISVYAAHTNMDIIEDGLNDWFCEMLEVEVTGYLKQTHEIDFKKLVTYVPEVDADKMRQALGDTGGGNQGNYHHTSYSMKGTGRFTPSGKTNPTIGAVGKAEEVLEERIEVIYPETIENQLLSAMYQVHPYEEPAFDLIKLDNPPKTYGIGRVGKLSAPVTIENFTQKVKDTFQIDGLRLVEATHSKEMVQTVAICGGSGGNFYLEALKAEADVYITGDVYYHTAHDMQTNGLTVIDPGHNIEVVCIPKFVEKMNEWKKEADWDIDIIPSETNTNPFQFR